jgi:hypothetical protein
MPKDIYPFGQAFSRKRFLPKLELARFLVPRLIAPHEVITQDQHVHFGAQKAVQCLLRTADDRLVFIKRSIEHHWYSGQTRESLD